MWTSPHNDLTVRRRQDYRVDGGMELGAAASRIDGPEHPVPYSTRNAVRLVVGLLDHRPVHHRSMDPAVVVGMTGITLPVVVEHPDLVSHPD